jgi:hypothetical protein
MPDRDHPADSYPGQASPWLTAPVLDGLPISVWTTGQRSAPVQRRGRYLPASTQHPARMGSSLIRVDLLVARSHSSAC